MGFPRRSVDRTAVQLYTPDEAADLLRCKASWLKEQARLRRIPFTLVAGAYRFTVDHLIQIIENNEHLPVPEQAVSTSRFTRTTDQHNPARALRSRRPRPRDPI
ncbi:DNA-binding protein [Jiangella asiatica]|uniref:DNA-binding protein n=1 Tax=Jiangella asiatica TaxID=2530372 RepID=A0A4R5D777_9ACTN|nr:DNA-binding protein [Jiangella asiatica]